MKISGLHNSLPRVKAGSASLVVLEICPVGRGCQHLRECCHRREPSVGHALPTSYLHDFVVLIIRLLENSFLAIWVFLVIALGVAWRCSARTELSSPNMVKLGIGTPWTPAFLWKFLLGEAALIILSFWTYR